MTETKDIKKFLGKECVVQYDRSQKSLYIYSGIIKFIGKYLLIIDDKKQGNTDLLLQRIVDIKLKEDFNSFFKKEDEIND